MAQISYSDVAGFVTWMVDYVDEEELTFIETAMSGRSSASMFEVSIELFELVHYKNTRDIRRSLLRELQQSITCASDTPGIQRPFVNMTAGTPPLEHTVMLTFKIHEIHSFDQLDSVLKMLGFVDGCADREHFVWLSDLENSLQPYGNANKRTKRAKTQLLYKMKQLKRTNPKIPALHCYGRFRNNNTRDHKYILVD